jgi:hypothetical protein
MAKQQIGLKLDSDMVRDLDAAAHRVGITRTEAIEQACRAWLDGEADPAGVLPTLPKAPPMPKAKAPPVRRSAQTKAPPPVSGARVPIRVDVGGPVRPAPGSRLKRR